ARSSTTSGVRSVLPSSTTTSSQSSWSCASTERMARGRRWARSNVQSTTLQDGCVTLTGSAAQPNDRLVLEPCAGPAVDVDADVEHGVLAVLALAASGDDGAHLGHAA